MKCITCGNDAVAVCKFCGRAVCSQHIQEDVFATGFSAQRVLWNMQENAVLVKDAVWCGICNPEHENTE